MANEYMVRRATGAVNIDADWKKDFWKDIDAAQIANVLGETCGHVPKVDVKLAYDDERLYVIFRVEDQFVRAVTTEMHGGVCEDSCVEFFFTPEQERRQHYFNLEANCCGTMLMQRYSSPRQDARNIDIEKCRKIKIASSLSGPITEEITEPVVWTLEYGLPFEIFSEYEGFVKPKSGIKWYGNFYKCADKSSRPHWMTWAPIVADPPDFHLPDFFGTLKFE